jgi:hypothetical protein
MKLQRPPPRYDERDQTDVRAKIEQADDENVKRNRDYEVGAARIILKSPDGTRYAITVSNAGALSAVAM